MGKELDNLNDSFLFSRLDTQATNIVLFSSINVTAFNVIESVNEVIHKRSSDKFLFGSSVIVHKLVKQFSQKTVWL
jgi:hypothetical protein